MRVDGIDPRVVEAEVDSPAYLVTFWRRQTPVDGAAAEEMGYESDTCRVEDADIGEVMAWAAERGKEFDTYVISVFADDRTAVRLFGHAPDGHSP
jgi:hypothetical protein